MQRLQQLTVWLQGQFPGEKFSLAPASSDASFRRYFRVSFDDGGCDSANGSLQSSGEPVGLPPAGRLLMEPLADRLNEQTTLAKSLVMAKPADCGNSRQATPSAPDNSTVTHRGGRTLIVMDAPPDREDCRPFLHVARLFEKAGTHVPHVYAEDLTQGFLLLSDLGNTTYLQALSLREQQGIHRLTPCEEDNARKLYHAATDALIKIQLASNDRDLPPYDEALLLREMRLFPEWYINKHLQVTLTPAQNAKLETVFARIVANNLAQPRVYVHRDYHSRNLMLVEPNGQARFPLSNPLPNTGEGANESLRENCLTSPGILDFQDAVYGPITYDLVSLFKDAYIKWDEEIVIDWLIDYWEKARRARLPVPEDFGQFYRDFELMGAQRHLKVLGIFARLYHRDGKDGYLKDMPLVMNYLRAACARYVDLKPLFNLLNELEPPEAPPTGYGF